MFGYLKQSTKIEMEGNYLKCFFAVVKSAASFIFFFLYCFSCIYLFIFDTSFFEKVGVFSNDYTLALSCAAAVITGFILLLFSYYVRYKTDFKFLSVFGNITPDSMSVSEIIKIMLLYNAVFIKKAFYLVLFSLPSIAFSAVVYLLATKGLSVVSLCVLLSADIIIFFSGIISASIYCQRYSLCVYEFSKEKDMPMRDIIKESILQMNGKCAKLFFLKILHIPKRILSLLIFPSAYFIPYCKAAESLFILEKENPYISRKRYAEKPVVFYFEKRTV